MVWLQNHVSQLLRLSFMTLAQVTPKQCHTMPQLSVWVIDVSPLFLHYTPFNKSLIMTFVCTRIQLPMIWLLVGLHLPRPRENWAKGNCFCWVSAIQPHRRIEAWMIYGSLVKLPRECLDPLVSFHRVCASILLESHASLTRQLHR